MRVTKYIFLFFLASLIILYLVGRGRTTIYIVDDNSKVKGKVISILIDNKQIYQDTLNQGYFQMEKLEKKLNWGFHKVKIKSKSGDILLNRTVFIFFRHYIVLTHADYCSDNSDSCFYLYYRFSEFLFD